MDAKLDSYGQQVERDLLTSRVVALFLESTFFGVFAGTYAIGVGELLRGSQPSSMLRRNRALLGVNTLMFILATIQLALTVNVTLAGFVSSRGSMGSVADAFHNPRFGSATTQVQFYIYVTQTLIGDVFMVCRLYAAWDGNRAVIAAPIVLVIIDAVGGFGSMYDKIYVAIILPIVFFAFSFFTNMLCTGLYMLIMWRLLQSDKLLHESWRWHSRAWFNIVQYRRLVEAIVQSAAIYSVASIAFVATSFLSPNVGYEVCLSVFSQVIGLVFALIVVQLLRKSALSQPSNLAGWRSSREHEQLAEESAIPSVELCTTSTRAAHLVAMYDPFPNFSSDLETGQG